MEIFFFYEFGKSFVNFAKKQRPWGKGKPCLIKLISLVVVLMTLENGIRFLLTCVENFFISANSGTPYWNLKHMCIVYRKRLSYKCINEARKCLLIIHSQIIMRRVSSSYEVGWISTHKECIIKKTWKGNKSKLIVLRKFPVLMIPFKIKNILNQI